jgi:hypothetical protein
MWREGVGLLSNEGWMGYILKEKLKMLKGAIRKWNNKVYIWV